LPEDRTPVAQDANFPEVFAGDCVAGKRVQFYCRWCSLSGNSLTADITLREIHCHGVTGGVGWKTVASVEERLFRGREP
jgi:hypothetical protein